MSDNHLNPDIEALRRLAEAKPEEAFPEILTLLSHEDWNVRKAGAELFGSTGTAGMNFLRDRIDLEKDPAEQQNLCYWATVIAFDHQLDDISVLQFLYSRGENHIKKSILDQMRVDTGNGDLEFLFKALGENSWDVREKASKVFIAKGTEVVEFLENKFSKANPDQRFWTFRIFAILLGSTATSYFSKFLKQDPQNEQLQVFAVSNLGEINDARVIKTLLNFLKSDSFLITEEVIRSLKKQLELQKEEILGVLEKSKEPRELEALLRVLADSIDPDFLKELNFLFQHEDHRTRYLAVFYLGHIPSQETARILIRCFTDSRWAIRKLAMDKIVKLGTYSVVPLVDALKHELEDVVFWALRSLVAIGEESTLTHIATLLEAGTREIRLLALEAILAIGSEESTEIFMEAFNNSFWEVRQRASELYSQLPHHPIPSLLEGCFAGNQHTRFWAQRTLQAMGLEGLNAFLAQIKNLDAPLLFIKNLRLADASVLEEQLKRPKPDISEMEASATNSLHSTPGRKRQGKSQDSDQYTIPSFEAGCSLPDSTPYAISIGELFKQGANLMASDIHLKSSYPPILRVKGRLSPMKMEKLTEGHISHFLEEILNASELERLLDQLQVDASFESSKSIRLRINIFKTMTGFELAGRFITDRIPSFESLNLPIPTMQKIVSVENGLVILTGPTGSGKTSTLAAMINYLNALVHKRIICIEDPIEYVHESNLCYISQREVHNDVTSFPIGIRATLREDPDVILIGELRDRESVETALTLAGTGHLVLTTLHAPTSTTAVEQLLDFFPQDQQNHIRKQIAFNFRAIISQRLLRHKSGKYRVPACEVLVTTPAVRNIIRDGKTEQLPTMIETAKKEGMVSLDQVLKKLVNSNEVTLEEAWPHVVDPKMFRA